MNSEKQQQPKPPKFNPDRRAITPAAVELVDDVTGTLISYERYRGLRKRERRANDAATFRLTVEAVSANLLHTALTVGPDTPIAVPLSRRRLGVGGRYAHPALNRQLPYVLDIMTAPEMGYVVLRKQKPGASVFNTPMASSTIKAGPHLLTKAHHQNVTAVDFATPSTGRLGEVIILRDVKPARQPGKRPKSAPTIDYEETSMTENCRNEVTRINEHLCMADITYEGEGHTCDPSNRSLKRIFNNGSFTQGGRLFGGFWQDLSKRQRLSGIRIDGDNVISLDYSQMGPKILYGMAHASPPGEDLYLIPALVPGYADGADPALFKDSRARKGVKIVFNALINTTTLDRMPQGSRPYFRNALRVVDVVKAISGHHAPIRHLLFDPKIGMEVMYRESEILIDVLLALAEQGITALPVHDAIIVADHAESEARRVMLEVFKAHTGLTGKVDQEQAKSDVQ